MEYSEIFTISLHNIYIFFDLEKIIFENFNIFENNIINVELANVLRYFSFHPFLTTWAKSLSLANEKQSFIAEEQMIFLAQVLCKALTVNYVQFHEPQRRFTVFFSTKKSTERPIYLLQFIW
jgi:hypothetical protein